MTARSLTSVVMAMAAVVACGKPAAKADGSGKPATAPVAQAAGAPDATAAEAQAPAAKTPTVVLSAPGREPLRVAVEVARTDEERRRGLMYRQNMAPDAGMLFLFEEDEVHNFWMKNTLIPLDMIFIRADGTVAGVVENAEPRTTTGRHIDKTSRHVLEVNGGWARAHGVGEGTQVTYENIPEVPK